MVFQIQPHSLYICIYSGEQNKVNILYFYKLISDIYVPLTPRLIIINIIILQGVCLVSRDCFCPQCVYVFLLPGALITIHVKWTSNNWLKKFYNILVCLYVCMTLAVNILVGHILSNKSHDKRLLKKTNVTLYLAVHSVLGGIIH